MTLNLPDYRSVERTFQLITQMAGRAGRSSHPGRVILQTYEPIITAFALPPARTTAPSTCAKAPIAAALCIRLLR